MLAVTKVKVVKMSGSEKKSEHEDPSGHSLEKDLLPTFFSNLAQKDGVDVPVFARYSKCFFQVTCKILET